MQLRNIARGFDMKNSEYGCATPNIEYGTPKNVL